jgi:hypothetical protein
MIFNMNDIFVVKLTNSDNIAIVDYDAPELVKQLRWRKDNSHGYIVSGQVRSGNFIYLHKLLCLGILVDHKNRLKGDNRRSNLRQVSKALNTHNSRKQAGCTSKYKGVSYNKNKMKWEAYIAKDGKRNRLGYFNSEVDAAKAVDKASAKLYNTPAALNFMEDFELYA